MRLTEAYLKRTGFKFQSNVAQWLKSDQVLSCLFDNVARGLKSADELRCLFGSVACMFWLY